MYLNLWIFSYIGTTAYGGGTAYFGLSESPSQSAGDSSLVFRVYRYAICHTITISKIVSTWHEFTDLRFTVISANNEHSEFNTNN